MAPALATLQTPPGTGEACPLRVPNLPDIRTFSPSQFWLDAGSLLNTAGGDRQGRGEELLTEPTRKVPVTTGTARGSAVKKGTVLETGWDLRGCLQGPSWGRQQRQRRSLSWPLEKAPVPSQPRVKLVCRQPRCAQHLSPPSLLPVAGSREPPNMESHRQDRAYEHNHLPQPVTEPPGDPRRHQAHPSRRQGPPHAPLSPADWELLEHRDYFPFILGSSQTELLSPPSDWGPWKVGAPSLPSDWEISEDRDHFSITLDSSWAGSPSPLSELELSEGRGQAFSIGR